MNLIWKRFTCGCDGVYGGLFILSYSSLIDKVRLRPSPPSIIRWCSDRVVRICRRQPSTHSQLQTKTTSAASPLKTSQFSMLFHQTTLSPQHYRFSPFWTKFVRTFNTIAWFEYGASYSLGLMHYQKWSVNKMNKSKSKVNYLNWLIPINCFDLIF